MPDIAVAIAVASIRSRQLSDSTRLPHFQLQR
jgi:hypothetical protein